MKTRSEIRTKYAEQSEASRECKGSLKEAAEFSSAQEQVVIIPDKSTILDDCNAEQIKMKPEFDEMDSEQNLRKKEFIEDNSFTENPVDLSENNNYERVDSRGEKALETTIEQQLNEGITEHTIEGLNNDKNDFKLVDHNEGGSVNLTEVIGHEVVVDSSLSDDLQNLNDAVTPKEEVNDNYEMNPYKLNEKSRADIREGVMIGDIGEEDIRAIGKPLRERYNELFSEALSKLDSNEEKRKDLIRQEIYSKSHDELMGIKDQLQALRRDDTEIMMSYTPMSNMEKVLKEAREIGVPENDTGQFYINETDASVKRVIAVINDARTRLPTEWVEKSNSEPIMAEHTLRGYFIKTDGISTIALSSFHGMERCAYHELGHHAEEMYPEIRKLEHEFYNRRTKGEYSRWLGPPYPLREKYRPDNFLSGYMGKDYGNTEESGYEIFSMGMEGLYTGSHKLHRDTDYQDFVFGILAAI